jgi:hypothetical protein
LTALSSYYVAAGANVFESVKAGLRYVLNYPDLYHKVVHPWMATIPATSAILGLLALLGLRTLFSTSQTEPEKEQSTRYLYGVALLLLLLVGVLSQPYVITRYTYFLYPLLLILAALGVLILARKIFHGPGKSVIAGALLLPVLFIFAEDFSVRHLFKINEPQFRYRTAYSDKLATHYYPRWDFRSAADFVNQNLAENDKVIVFDQPLPHYLNRTTGIYLGGQGSGLHEMIAACGGKKDRWSNAPLLRSKSAVMDFIRDSNRPIWLIIRTDKYPWRDPLENEIASAFKSALQYETNDGHLAVYRLTPDSPFT